MKELIIVGAGDGAGLLAAKIAKLKKENPSVKVVIIDEGKDIQK